MRSLRAKARATLVNLEVIYGFTARATELSAGKLYLLDLESQLLTVRVCYP